MMFSIKMEGMDTIVAGFKGLERRLPYAIATALNDLAFKIRSAEQTEVKRVFKNPTPFTVNSLWVEKAKAQVNPIIAKVGFKDPPNLSQKEHYLMPQVAGGSRPLKPYEMGLGGRYTVPGKGMMLDQYGNMGRGQLTKILSQSGLFRESGYKMNRTRKGNKVGDMFMLTKRRGKMLPGIYARVSTGSQLSRATNQVINSNSKNQSAALKRTLNKMGPRGLRPVLIFPSKSPTYSKRFDFFGVAQRTHDAMYREVVGNTLQQYIDGAFSKGWR
jgi:hypothetical protein